MFGRLKLVGFTIVMMGAGRWHADDYSAVVCVLTGTSKFALFLLLCSEAHTAGVI